MDLDDILNDALEEVSKEEDDDFKVSSSAKNSASSSASSSTSPSSTTTIQSALSSAAASTAKAQSENLEQANKDAAANAGTGEEAELANLLKMFGGGSDFEKILDEAFKDLDLNDLMSKLGLDPNAAEGIAAGASAGGGPGGEDAEMEKLMKMLTGNLQGGGEGAGPGGEGALDPKLLEQLASRLEDTMGGDQMNKMFENMMKSVMSKDIMYEPIKAITDEYPKYLSQKGIKAEDRSRYEAQYSAYKALRVTFEQEPENSDKIMQIIQDLERYGQPPPEISKILSANGGGEGAMPGLPPGMNPNACPTQ